MERVLVTGAGGFIGHHLVTFLKERGYWVRGVDLKYPEFTDVRTDDFRILDLRRCENCLEATEDVDHVYASPLTWAGWASSPKITPPSCPTTHSSTARTGQT